MHIKVGDKVEIAPNAYTRAGHIGTVAIVVGDSAAVEFEDGESFGYLLDDDELILIGQTPDE